MSFKETLMQVRLYATLRQTVGTKVVEIPVKVNQTVGDILRALVDQYPELSEAIWYADGSLASHVAVILNGRDIRHLDNVDTPLTDDDTLDLFPPVGGGLSEEENT
jgi:molybdopterin synthase sulfur carrier subunit